MVARMESDPSVPALLRQAERAAAAPYVDYPATPHWYPPAVGAWAAAMVLAVASLPDHPVVATIGLVVLVAGEAAFFAWYRRYRQTMPSLQGAPHEISDAFRRYAVGLFVVLALCGLTFLVAGLMACVVVTFVLVTGGLAIYERHYANAAQAARDRLGPPR